jgi:hypothetical protein
MRPVSGITDRMPRSPGQSDFVVSAEPEVFDEPLPPTVDPVSLPRAILRSNEATARATRIVMTVTWIVLAALVILTLVGPHIPSGE